MLPSLTSLTITFHLFSFSFENSNVMALEMCLGIVDGRIRLIITNTLLSYQLEGYVWLKCFCDYQQMIIFTFSFQVSISMVHL